MLTSRGHDRPHKQFTVTDVKAAQASEDPIEVFDEEFQELPESGSTTSGSTCSDSPDDASTDDDDGAFEADES